MHGIYYRPSIWLKDNVLSLLHRLYMIMVVFCIGIFRFKSMKLCLNVLINVLIHAGHVDVQTIVTGLIMWTDSKVAHSLNIITDLTGYATFTLHFSLC